MPKNDAMARGAVENAKIPSSEYRNSLWKFHVEVPAARSVFSISMNYVSKPTQLKMPFEKRLYSGISKMAFTI